MTPLIEFRDVAVDFDGQIVLGGFDLAVEPGEKVVVYGKSGTGKSTLLRLVLGFARSSRGTVSFEGKHLDRRAVVSARTKIAYVVQDLDIAEGAVSDFVGEALSYRANAHLDGARKRLRVAMEMFELGPGITEKAVTDLSGGERQRLALSLAISLGRDVYLLDEVTSAVDVSLKKAVVAYFAGLDGATVLSVSHDPHWLEDSRFRVVRLGER